MTIYTESDYARERAIVDKADAYARSCMAYRGPKCHFITKEEAEHPDYAACNNAMRSRVERFEIFRDKPAVLVAYLDSTLQNVTTWTGDLLGTVSMGKPYKSNMGDKRYPFRTTIAGQNYAGIGYGGAGMYARLRKVA